MLIKKVRQQHGFTQTEVADLVGIGLRHYQYIEAGKHKPSYEVLCKLEDLFQMSHRELLKKNNSHCSA